MNTLNIYKIVSEFIHNQTAENAKNMYIKLMQNLQDEFAYKNGTIGVDAISVDEMDIQNVINSIQNNF